MKCPNCLEVLKKGLEAIPHCLLNFAKKLAVNAAFYIVGVSVPLLVALPVLYIVGVTTHNHSAALLVFKIIFTIGQIIPLSVSLYISEWELTNTNENSSELCFAVCATVIAYVWLKF